MMRESKGIGERFGDLVLDIIFIEGERHIEDSDIAWQLTFFQALAFIVPLNIDKNNMIHNVSPELKKTSETQLTMGTIRNFTLSFPILQAVFPPGAGQFHETGLLA